MPETEQTLDTLDFIVLIGYFIILLVIGFICSWSIRRQEDFFMGGRSFGRLLQTFAAFGAGTGAQDPINIGRTTWTSGLSGIWSALNWLFITPFYWIFAVWYRRMRLITLGDWFVERYQSKALGVAYTIFAFSFQILYLSVMFSAISKVVEPLLGSETVMQLVDWIGSDNPDDLRYILVPSIAIVVLAYGVLGGLAAAYWTDLIQGLGIIMLSIILIPTGLNALVESYGSQYPQLTEGGRQLSTMDGFTIMHDRLSPDYFQLFNAPQSGEFSIQFIIALIAVSLIGIVVQPHFIATGGGSAKTENSARIGLVSGNFLKRICTVGWGLTGLIALALLAGNPEISGDPDQVWGIASRTILGPLGLGLVGLMLACLLAALMSSADTYMLVSSALLVRNVYAAYIDPNATEKTYVAVGRLAGLFIICGAAIVSIGSYNVLSQYVLALEVAASFSAPFWIGMFWRGATKIAAWVAILFSVSVLVVLPVCIPLLYENIRFDQRFAVATNRVTKTTTRVAGLVDVERRDGEIAYWELKQKRAQEAVDRYREVSGNIFPSGIKDVSELPELSDRPDLVAVAEKAIREQSKFQSLGPKKAPITLGSDFVTVYREGGESVFWSGGLQPISKDKEGSIDAVFKAVPDSSKVDGNTKIVVEQYDCELKGVGRFNLEYMVYQLAGIDMKNVDKTMLKTMSIPPRILTPFLIMIIVSLLTPGGNKEKLDRYYVKMKTPVHPDPEMDRQNLEISYANPNRFDNRKLFPGTSLEFQKPGLFDLLGFFVCLLICFLFIWLLLWLASLGA